MIRSALKRLAILVLAAASDSCLEALVEILAAAGELGVLARHRIAP